MNNWRTSCKTSWGASGRFVSLLSYIATLGSHVVRQMFPSQVRLRRSGRSVFNWLLIVRFCGCFQTIKENEKKKRKEKAIQKCLVWIYCWERLCQWDCGKSGQTGVKTRPMRTFGWPSTSGIRIQGSRDDWDAFLNYPDMLSATLSDLSRHASSEGGGKNCIYRFGRICRWYVDVTSYDFVKRPLVICTVVWFFVIICQF